MWPLYMTGGSWPGQNTMPASGVPNSTNPMLTVNSPFRFTNSLTPSSADTHHMYLHSFRVAYGASFLVFSVMIGMSG